MVIGYMEEDPTLANMIFRRWAVGTSN